MQVSVIYSDSRGRKRPNLRHIHTCVVLGRCESYLSERLSHLPQEVLGELDSLVHGEVQTAVTDVLLNPARKLPTFVCSGVTLWMT